MIRRAALLLVVLLAAGCAVKPYSLASKLALTASIGCEGSDLATTMFYRGKGTVRELNPILRPFQDRPLAFSAVKGGLAAVGQWGLWSMQEKQPTFSTWALAANAAGKCALAVMNDRRGRR